MTLTLKRIRTGNAHWLEFQVPDEPIQALKKLYERAAKHGDMMVVTLGTPQKPRTTGKGSQNSAVHGWSAEIAEQLTTDGKEITAEDVYEAMKRMAVGEGYPTRYNPIDAREEPESFTRISVEQASILIQVIQRFADENGLHLTEIIEGIPTKLTGGKGIRRGIV